MLHAKVYKNYSLPFRPQGVKVCTHECEGKKVEEKELIATEL